MHSIMFVTGNNEKFDHAVQLCSEYGISLEQARFDIDEIQGEDAARIIDDKATKAYGLAKQPVIVSDDSWSIPGLNGFPGAYMKSMDHWFTAEDFLRLTTHLKDRRVILHQWLAYKNGTETTLFKQYIEGTLITQVRGVYGNPAQKIISFPIDNGLTISEVYDRGNGTSPHRTRALSGAWIDFCTWYKQQP